MRKEEEEEEEAVFIRGVNTNEDSPNAQHAPHRPVQDTGAMRSRSRSRSEGFFTLLNQSGGRWGEGRVYSHSNLLRGKPNSLSRGPVAGLLCVVGEDHIPTYCTLLDAAWC